MLPVNPSTTRQTTRHDGYYRQPVSHYIEVAAGVRVGIVIKDSSQSKFRYPVVTYSRLSVFRDIRSKSGNQGWSHALHALPEFPGENRFWHYHDHDSELHETFRQFCLKATTARHAPQMPRQHVFCAEVCGSAAPKPLQHDLTARSPVFAGVGVARAVGRKPVTCQPRPYLWPWTPLKNERPHPHPHRGDPFFTCAMEVWDSIAEFSLPYLIPVTHDRV